MRLAFNGDLDADSVPALWRRHRDAGAISVIDLAGVTRLDSAGVALVRVLQRRSLAAGQQIALEQLPGHYSQLEEAHRLQPVGDQRD